jgi:hypothetical protein
LIPLNHKVSRIRFVFSFHVRLKFKLQGTCLVNFFQTLTMVPSELVTPGVLHDAPQPPFSPPFPPCCVRLHLMELARTILAATVACTSRPPCASAATSPCTPVSSRSSLSGHVLDTSASPHHRESRGGDLVAGNLTNGEVSPVKPPLPSL